MGVAWVHCPWPRSVTAREFSFGFPGFFVAGYAPDHPPAGRCTGMPGRHRIDLYPCDPLRLPLQIADFPCPILYNFPTKKMFECVGTMVYMVKGGSHGYNHKNGRTDAAPCVHSADRSGKTCAIPRVVTVNQGSDPLRDPVYEVCAIKESRPSPLFFTVRWPAGACGRCPHRIQALDTIYDVNRIFRVPRLHKNRARYALPPMRLPHSRRGRARDPESGIFGSNPVLESVFRLLAA